MMLKISNIFGWYYCVTSALLRVSKDGHGKIVPASILRDPLLRMAPQLDFGQF